MIFAMQIKILFLGCNAMEGDNVVQGKKDARSKIYEMVEMDDGGLIPTGLEKKATSTRTVFVRTQTGLAKRTYLHKQMSFIYVLICSVYTGMNI